MSVPKSKRNLSQLEFYHTAFTLRKNLTELLLKDFSIKDMPVCAGSGCSKADQEHSERFQG